MSPMTFFKDTLNDEISETIARMYPLNWTKEKHALKRRLIDQVLAEGFITFTGNLMFYELSCSGASAIVMVGPQQRGHLRPYRGKAVRLICLGSWGMSRLYAAKLLTAPFIAIPHPITRAQALPGNWQSSVAPKNT